MSNIPIAEKTVRQPVSALDSWGVLTEDRLWKTTMHAIVIAGGITGSLFQAYVSEAPGLSLRSASASMWIAMVFASFISQSLFAGIAGFCALIAIRLTNNVLGRPLNLPAVAAIAGGFSLLATIGIPIIGNLAMMAFNRSETSALSIDVILLIWLNAFVIQFLVRLWVGRKIQKHNQSPAAVRFSCHGCQQQFQIKQLLIATTIIAVLIASANAAGFTDSVFMVVGGILLLAIGTTFLPAALAAEKLIPLPILSPGQSQTQPAQPLTSQAASLNPDTNYVNIPVSPTRATWEGSSGIAIAGMHFAVVFTFMLTASGLVHGNSAVTVPPVFAIPGAFVGFILAGFCGFLLTIVLMTLNSIFRNLVLAGHVTATAGGVTGFACSLFVVESWEILHRIPNTMFYDLHDYNNLFPLAAVFLATVMGQIYARVKVKRFLLGKCYSPEVATLTATGTGRGLPMVAKPGLLVCLAILAVTLLPPESAFVPFALLLACMSLAWPLGCFVARMVDQKMFFDRSLLA